MTDVGAARVRVSASGGRDGARLATAGGRRGDIDALGPLIALRLLGRGLPLAFVVGGRCDLLLGGVFAAVAPPGVN